MRGSIASIILLSGLSISGCMDQDPFGLSKRNIAGDYYLQEWEDGKTFYLHDAEREYNEFPDLGPIGGTVVQMGWNSNYIIVQRQAHQGGKVDGWMVIDVANKRITGPLPWDLIRRDARYNEITIFNAKEAWDEL